ncbi:YopX family protein [Paenibacillus polymyxa]|uniref:YopX family protein n=1 Tax=Paenibacillus polymyxa TaxID=1406 RepID=UPI0020258161|nr:YopX family protein [Paenibacillus polymyxa]URJ46413.1 YopX family protein [Paenibacillus polymyxa]
MRELKYKFWDREEKRMIGPNLDSERYYIGSYNGLALFDTEREDEDGYTYQMDVEFLQYTGLKDRNGKEAYHKDIVDYEGFLYVIEWDEKNTGFYLAYIRDLHNPESEEHLKGSCITLSTIKSHILEPGKLLLGEDTP